MKTLYRFTKRTLRDSKPQSVKYLLCVISTPVSQHASKLSCIFLFSLVLKAISDKLRPCPEFLAFWLKTLQINISDSKSIVNKCPMSLLQSNTSVNININKCLCSI